MSSHTTKKALVLSGGSVKGAFEAGALKAVFEKGFKPEYLYGISAGNLNSSFVTHEAAKQYLETGTIDWPKVGEALWNFWDMEITESKKLVKKRSNVILLLSLNWSLIFKKFNSLLDTTPLQKLVKRIMDPAIIRQAPVKLRIGAVNIYNGEIVYVDPSHPHFLDYVIASTAIPVLMPVKEIEGIPYFDGGLRDVAPFGKAINEGADEIVGVCCQSEKLNHRVYNYKDLTIHINRIMDIVVTEIVNNDIKMIRKINSMVEEHPGQPGSRHARYKHIKSTVIRPDNEIVINIQDFEHHEITNLLNQGYQKALETLNGKTWS